MLIRSVCGLRWLSAKQKQPLPHRASTSRAQEWCVWPRLVAVIIDRLVLRVGLGSVPLASSAWQLYLSKRTRRATGPRFRVGPQPEVPHVHSITSWP